MPLLTPRAPDAAAPARSAPALVTAGVAALLASGCCVAPLAFDSPIR